MSDNTQDYTLQLALLREAIGLPLRDQGKQGGAIWWGTEEKLPYARRWVTLATGALGFYREDRVVVSNYNYMVETTPDPNNWLIISGWNRGGNGEIKKVLWPPVPLSDLLSKLADPNFRMEYMLPKLPRKES